MFALAPKMMFTHSTQRLSVARLKPKWEETVMVTAAQEKSSQSSKDRALVLWFDKVGIADIPPGRQEY